MTVDTGSSLARIEMLDAGEVAARLGRWVPLGASLARSWAEAGRIVGVTQGARRLYPACQFDAVGLPLPVMRDLILVLRPGMSDAAILCWLGTDCPALQEARPAELLPVRPDAVLDAARLMATGRAPAAA
ncbi:hypothetical protein CLV79_1084 [Limimaricola soesokkakensis]|uniref:Antitoxin Xre/MbcA/ParS-like toxin-binding domain-containing protein n=1 Tax=Limimaricola soesokkakensis TaxID=1343159 RepID=A0A1X6ZIL5_9RHOB|nr:hypothetical protein [Limimaricola soesokkakensis]PSK84838.1 hypothetical protein CLV79_1084 [Limimaricola soesokkakensis]SLN52183.1 hypothetical protein LOS8367_02385 [Limimaricola soesokkakensis]